MRKTPILSALIASVMAFPAWAGTLQNENLLMPLPQGFKLGFHNEQGAAQTDEFVASTETVDNWSRLITAQTFHGVKNADADAFAAGIAAQWKGSCAGGEAAKMISGTENNFPFSVWAFFCPLNPTTQKPENMWMKLISGGDSLYVVQDAYRQELTKELVVPAVRYLKAVSACDTRRKDRPCPAGM